MLRISTHHVDAPPPLEMDGVRSHTPKNTATTTYTSLLHEQPKWSLVHLMYSGCTRLGSTSIRIEHLWRIGVFFFVSVFIILFFTLASAVHMHRGARDTATTHKVGELMHATGTMLRVEINTAHAYSNTRPRHEQIPKASAFILGMQKCGTTSLAGSLGNHPELVWPINIEGLQTRGRPVEGRMKEMQFFNRKKLPKWKNTTWYNDHWPDPLPTEHARYIEATPGYLRLAYVPRNMKAAYGDAFAELKFVVILANPTQRHVSWFNHIQVKHDLRDNEGKVSHDMNADIESLVRQSPMMRMDDFDRSCGNDECYDGNPLLIGAYAGMFKMWFKIGARPDQFAVVFLEEYLNDTAGTLRRVTDFLGIGDLSSVEAESTDADTEVEALSQNRREHRQYLTPENEDLLNRFYRPWNCRLGSLLDSTGIRSWEDARAGAGSWFPSREECEVPKQKELPKPTAFVLGMAKCGTTSLFGSLMRHPELVWPTYRAEHAGNDPKKGLFYFVGSDSEMDVAWYNEYWPGPLPTPDARYMEGTPAYFKSSNALHNMRAAYGDDGFARLKFIVILKDPTRRHVSWFNHQQVAMDLRENDGKIVHDMNADVQTFLHKSAERTMDDLASCHSGDCYRENPLLMGAYAPMFEMWLDHGARPDQFEVVFLDEYMHDTAGTLRRLTDFLGVGAFGENTVEDGDHSSGEAVSENRHEHGQDLTPENEDLLNAFYMPWNCRLGSLLDSTGIRSWEDAHAGAGSWFPSREECEVPKPTAFVLGMMKCGTTSLSVSLMHHPDLVWPVARVGEPEYFPKELHFFEREDDPDIAFYNSHWLNPLPTEHARYIEGTPYFHMENSPRNMKAIYGDDGFAGLKFIVILKDPMQQHVSWFNHIQVRDDLRDNDGKIVHDMNADIQAFLYKTRFQSIKRAERTADELASCHSLDCYDENPLLLGAYASMFEMWLDHGARPDQFEVVFLDEYMHDTAGTLRRLTDFLGVGAFGENTAEDGDHSSGEAVSENRHEHGQDLTPENEAELKAFYMSWNCRLGSLLDSTGIRSWEDAHAGAGSWFPSREECETS